MLQDIHYKIQHLVPSMIHAVDNMRNEAGQPCFSCQLGNSPAVLFVSQRGCATIIKHLGQLSTSRRVHQACKVYRGKQCPSFTLYQWVQRRETCNQTGGVATMISRGRQGRQVKIRYWLHQIRLRQPHSPKLFRAPNPSPCQDPFPFAIAAYHLCFADTIHAGQRLS